VIEVFCRGTPRRYGLGMQAFRDRILRRAFGSARARLGLNEVHRALDEIRGELGRLQARFASEDPDIHVAEFTAFSQFGEDGILQWLLKRVDVAPTFVELGSADYSESNTRFLAQVFGWRGLIVDGSAANVQAAREQWWFERRDVQAIAAFVSVESASDLMSAAPSPLGLLTIDLDGMDYWIWRSLDVSPTIVMIEYNARFGPTQSVTVPYDPTFERSKAHHSHVYFGASIEALRRLGASKGYSLVACSESGVNAFFVRTEIWGSGVSAADAFRRHAHHEHRDQKLKLTFMPTDLETAELRGLAVVSVGEDGEPAPGVSKFEPS
jgi:hypothetical protein